MKPATEGSPILRRDVLRQRKRNRNAAGFLLFFSNASSWLITAPTVLMYGLDSEANPIARKLFETDFVAASFIKLVAIPIVFYVIFPPIAEGIQPYVQKRYMNDLTKEEAKVEITRYLLNFVSIILVLDAVLNINTVQTIYTPRS